MTERCFAAALRLLGYRPRSRAELRQRLLRRGFSDILIDKVLMVLEQKGLVDDVAFARYWTENRLQFRPKSARLINLELRRKGVTPEIASEVTEGLDEESLAYRAGLQRVRVFANLTGEEFHNRLYHYLQRRGFAHAVIEAVLKRLRDDCRGSADIRGDEGYRRA